MRSMRIVFAALVAVFALGAVTASSAFASPEWYVKKAGKFAKVTTSANVVSTGTFELIDTKNPGGLTLSISCKGEASGPIKAGGIGEIEAFHSTSCVAGKGTLQSCKEKGIEAVEGRDLG
jgi:hypothetical protein